MRSREPPIRKKAKISMEVHSLLLYALPTSARKVWQPATKMGRHGRVVAICVCDRQR